MSFDIVTCAIYCRILYVIITISHVIYIFKTKYTSAAYKKRKKNTGRITIDIAASCYRNHRVSRFPQHAGEEPSDCHAIARRIPPVLTIHLFHFSARARVGAQWKRK